jgi:Tol biopolymer transport system component
MRLATGADSMISPDGRWVVYRRDTHSQPTQLLVISSEGGTPRLLSASSYDPVVWSPDSRLVAADAPGRLAIVDVRSGKSTTLHLPEASFGFSFSPDGSELAFTESKGSGQNVYTVSTHGGVIRRLTSDGRSGFPLWGPSGIAFERFGVDGQGDRCGNCHGDVWLMDANGGGVRQLTNTHAGIYPSAWSWDGTRLLAAYPATHNGKLYAVDVSTGHTRALTGFVGDLYAQGLSRNGHTVLAAIGCGGTQSPFGIVETIPFAGGKPTVIAHGPCRASWNA